MKPPASLISARPSIVSGYAAIEYARALEEFGSILRLPRCAGSLLNRTVPEGTASDAMGPYPIFACQDWTQLGDDLSELSSELVAVSLVTDCFADVSPTELQAAFPDVCYPYKEHFITDLSIPLDHVVHPHHRRNIRKAAARVQAFRAADSRELLSAWQSLYDHLIERHGITGIARFSPNSFAQQFAVPGFAAFAATDGENILGMTLWYQMGDAAYYHLGAYSQLGYELGASFAVFWNALSYFQGAGIRWAVLGAGAGTHAADSGLTRFKQGWATATRPTYFCGRVLQPEIYHRLSHGRANDGKFFPAYRAPTA